LSATSRPIDLGPVSYDLRFIVPLSTEESLRKGAFSFLWADAVSFR